VPGRLLRSLVAEDRSAEGVRDRTGPDLVRAGSALWFGPDPLPSVAELAARHGDRGGLGVHFSADSVRYLWLDRAQRA
jgi:hypothetical protein